MNLPESTHVHDLKTIQAYGQTREFKTVVRPNRASFFALLPSNAQATQLTFSDAKISRGSTLKLKIRVPEARGKHSLQISAILPDGSVAEWFSEQLIADEEPGEIDLRIAHDDPTGIWKIRVRDLYTGTAIENSFEVEE